MSVKRMRRTRPDISISIPWWQVRSVPLRNDAYFQNVQSFVSLCERQTVAFYLFEALYRHADCCCIHSFDISGAARLTTEFLNCVDCVLLLLRLQQPTARLSAASPSSSSTMLSPRPLSVHLPFPKDQARARLTMIALLIYLSQRK